MTLTFDFYDNLKFFKIEFETDSLQRNRLMNIELDGFSLDIPDFIDMHHDLYIRIMYEVKSQSQTFWNTVNGEITGIPTLDYRLNTKVLSFIVILIMISFGTLAQPTISFEGQSRGFGMNAGYILTRIETNIGYNTPINRKASVPYIFYGSIGYDILRSNDYVFIPALGFSKYHEETDPENGAMIDKDALFYSIEGGKNFTAISGINGRYYLFARHSVRMFVGAGLKIFID